MEVTTAFHTLASSLSLPHHIDGWGAETEGLTEEEISQGTQAAEVGSLPLLSAFIPSLQSPGNQGRGRTNEKGPGTRGDPGQSLLGQDWGRIQLGKEWGKMFLAKDMVKVKVISW